MAAPTKTDELIDLVRKSGLVASDKLDQFVAQVTHDTAPPTPRGWSNLLVKEGLITNFHAEQFLQGKWRGFTISKYRVLERLGFGGTGTVYLCEHLRVHRKVAIKVLPSAKNDNPAALGRFYREARAAGMLDHPNLVKCHDIDREGNLHFLVMDYVDGVSLQELVTRVGPLDPARAANYIAQAALGLQHAHEAGLIHRDVKPANILVDRTGVVKVLDLGLARFNNDDLDNLTLKYDENNVLGTADYVAPEQALNSHGVDIRADIYGLGCTFYFLLAGRPPFHEGKAAQKLIAHQVKPPTPIRHIRPQVPEEIASVLARMLEKDPRARQQTPGAVVNLLSQWLVANIAPPTEDELPMLSPAAAKNAPSPDSDMATTPRPGYISAHVRSQAITTTSPILSKRVVASNSRKVPVIPLPDLETPSAMAAPTVYDTAEAAERQRRRKAAPAQTSTRKFSALRVFAVLAASALIGIVLRFGLGRSQTVAQVPPTSAILLVSRSAGEGGFTSIFDAIYAAHAGDTVRIDDDSWEESLKLNGAAGIAADITLEGGGNQPLLWTPARGQVATEPLLGLNNVCGMRLRNIVFDGQNRLHDLVHVVGRCPGVTFEQLRLVGFSHSAIAFHGCEGSHDHPVLLKGLRAVGYRDAHAALSFDTKGQEGNSNIQVIDGRFEGPFTAAVSIQGTTSSLEIKHNRIFNSLDGIALRRSAKAASCEVTVLSNTFCNIAGVGVHVEQPPAENSHMIVAKNLFARTATLARLEGSGSARWLEMVANVCDSSSKEGSLPLKAVAVDFELPTDPVDDLRFLRYNRASLLTLAGEPGVPPAPKP